MVDQCLYDLLCDEEYEFPADDELEDDPDYVEEDEEAEDEFDAEEAERREATTSALYVERNGHPWQTLPRAGMGRAATLSKKYLFGFSRGCPKCLLPVRTLEVADRLRHRWLGGEIHKPGDSSPSTKAGQNHLEPKYQIWVFCWYKLFYDVFSSPSPSWSVNLSGRGNLVQTTKSARLWGQVLVGVGCGTHTVPYVSTLPSFLSHG